MPRTVLLEIDDREVDVLSRLSDSERRDLIVVHSNPEALVRELALLAEIPVAPVPPLPRGDDVLVVTERPDAQVRAWVEDWRRAGARVMAVSSYTAGDGSGGAAPPSPGTAMDDDSPVVEIEPAPSGEAPASPAAPPHPVDTAPGASAERSNGGGDEHAVEAAEWRGGFPTDILAHPETTFRYLVGDAPAVLWWDGGEDVWVPWLVIGDARVGDRERGRNGTVIPSEWGRFRLALEREAPDLPMPALTRVVDDLALRDLAAWQKTRSALESLDRPARDGSLSELQYWGERVLVALDPQVGFLWRRGATGDWDLVVARGERVRFAGELRLPEPLLGWLFESSDSRWWTWEPRPGVRFDFALSGNDTRWPLRLHRVRGVLEGKRQPAA
jgi:hypothetical protein